MSFKDTLKMFATSEQSNLELIKNLLGTHPTPAMVLIIDIFFAKWSLDILRHVAKLKILFCPKIQKYFKTEAKNGPFQYKVFFLLNYKPPFKAWYLRDYLIKVCPTIF